ncbi:MAG: M4 family metallopeptidase [Anaerolineales bacterium]|nr:M4 family metallopeptidase [Anaerolineales bacterium]
MKSRWLNYTVLSMLVLSLLVPAAAGAQDGAISGFRALKGTEAASFQVPGDVRLVTSFELASYGLTYERYQQVFSGAEAEVLGGQLTLLKDGSAIKYVIGAHYPGITPTNDVNIAAAQARQRAANDVGAAGERITTLMINPDSGRYFFQVETRRAEARWFHWIDAGDGALLNKFNAIMHDCNGAAAPCGFGVQYTEDAGDVKDLSGLTTPSGGDYLLISSDGRQETHDQGSSRRPFLGPVASDADDSWVLLGDESPAQQALVDAHYYAFVTDAYYFGTHGYDWVDEAIAAGANDKMEVHAHYSVDYNNAFWNGSYISLGDGDQVTFEELTALDVVGHELSHGVTDFTSDLIYQDESGALNEAFSDIMGSSMEFWAEANGYEPATTLEPDWLIGEDFDLRGDTVLGFRNMGDPGEDGDPSHYDERYTGTDDNGGVHTNSGIANHWYYLLVNGGQNSDPTYASGTDVTGIGLGAAEPIAFLGFTALPADATFCDARAGTIAVAGAYDANVVDAWDEVGVDEALCGGGSTNNPPTADFTFTTSGLTVDFTDQSTDTDGSIVAWDWDFGDGNTSTEQNPSHTYASSGTYAVILVVSDDAGDNDSVSKDISVSDGTSDFTLSVNAYKVRGTQYADLTWSGATSTDVDVYRDGAVVATTSNDGEHTDITGQKGGGSATYQVCEAGTTTCSNEVQANW